MSAEGCIRAVGVVAPSMTVPDHHVALHSDCVYLVIIFPYDAQRMLDGYMTITIIPSHEHVKKRIYLL